MPPIMPSHHRPEATATAPPARYATYDRTDRSPKFLLFSYASRLSLEYAEKAISASEMTDGCGVRGVSKLGEDRRQRGKARRKNGPDKPTGGVRDGHELTRPLVD